MEKLIKKIFKTYSAEGKAKHLLEWKRSGLTMSEYCRRNNLSISSLSLWNKKANTKQIKLKPVITNFTPPIPIIHNVAITSANGLKITLDAIELSQVIGLINGIEKCS